MTSTRKGLLLTLALLSTGCASLTPPPGPGRSLRYAPREATAPAWAEGPEAPERSPRPARETVTAARPEPRSASRTRQAVVAALLDVSGSTRRLAGELSRLEASKAGIAGRYGGVFKRHVEQGVAHLRWMDAELAAATRLTTTALEVEDPDMQRALLRLTGPRLEAGEFHSTREAVRVAAERFERMVMVKEFLEGLATANRFKVAKALGSWSAFTPEEYEQRVDQVGDVLLATPPPPGWRPLGPDDELLLTLLPDETV